jgi:pimeloyl-ACP methyl ester carboxylesterase
MTYTKKARERKLRYRGYDYHYRIIEHPNPQFEPTFFISGAFQNMDSWSKFVRFFSQQTTVVVADLPGTGKADSLPSSIGFDFYSEAIARILQDANVNRVYVIAASYGTPIAYTFARNYQECVSRMVLAGTMKEIPQHLREHIHHSVSLAEQNEPEQFANYVIDNGLLCLDAAKHIAKRALTRRVLTTELKNMTARLLNHPPLDLSSAPDIPVLVFTGEHDVFTLPRHCREVAAAFPDAIYTTLKDSDHLFHIERFEVVLDLLQRFAKSGYMHNVAGCNTMEFLHNHKIPGMNPPRNLKRARRTAGAGRFLE